MLKFNEEKHEYTYSGVKKMSVTTIFNSVGVKNCDGKFISLSNFEYLQNLEISGYFGKVFHEYARLYHLGKRFAYDDQLEPWAAGHRKFIEKNPEINTKNCITSIVEMPMYCSMYDYCGTPDLVIEFPRKVIVLDWKTAVSYHKHYGWQISAYCEMVKEIYKRKPIEGWCVNILKNDFRVKKIKGIELKKNFNDFKSILNTYRLAA